LSSPFLSSRHSSPSFFLLPTPKKKTHDPSPPFPPPKPFPSPLKGTCCGFVVYPPPSPFRSPPPFFFVPGKISNAVPLLLALLGRTNCSNITRFFSSPRSLEEEKRFFSLFQVFPFLLFSERRNTRLAREPVFFFSSETLSFPLLFRETPAIDGLRSIDLVLCPPFFVPNSPPPSLFVQTVSLRKKKLNQVPKTGLLFLFFLFVDDQHGIGPPLPFS